jgi:hypothetical protein
VLFLSAQYLVRRTPSVLHWRLERQIVGFRRPARAAFAHVPMEVTVARFVRNANIEHYLRLIAESERNPNWDDDRHKTLLTLLAEEIAKDKKPLS